MGLSEMIKKTFENKKDETKKWFSKNKELIRDSSILTGIYISCPLIGTICNISGFIKESDRGNSLRNVDRIPDQHFIQRHSGKIALVSILASVYLHGFSQKYNDTEIATNNIQVYEVLDSTALAHISPIAFGKNHKFVGYKISTENGSCYFEDGYDFGRIKSSGKLFVDNPRKYNNSRGIPTGFIKLNEKSINTLYSQGEIPSTADYVNLENKLGNECREILVGYLKN